MKLENKLSLTIYANEEFTEVKRIVETDELKIPYKVTKYIAEVLQNVNTADTDALYNIVINSMDKVEKIIKATFGVSNTELEYIDTMEIVDMAMKLIKWAKSKFTMLNGASSKNAVAVAQN